MAIYNFARTADDFADEGDALASVRLQQLHDFKQMLKICLYEPQKLSGPHQILFSDLSEAVLAFNLPTEPFFHLLDAFEQDVLYTEHAVRYESQAALLRYCSKSANPIGRLLLHLYGIHEADSIRRSDAICTSLQLINFWQDLSIDMPRGRHYLPDNATLSEETAFARTLMRQGSPLVHTLPGRGGWELRLVVQGGLRVLDKLEGIDAFQHRPVLKGLDWLSVAWRALGM